MSRKIELLKKALELLMDFSYYVPLSKGQEERQLDSKALCVEIKAELAKPEAEPVKLCFPTMLRKMWSGGEVQKWLDEQPPLYTSPRPMQRLASEEISDLIDDHWEGDNEVHFINAIMDAMIEKNNGKN